MIFVLALAVIVLGGICIDAHKKRIKLQKQLELRQHILGKYHK